MIKVFFKYIPIGGKFTHNGKEYIKTNFSRGYYYNKDGQIVHKRFKKKNLVFSKETIWEIPPENIS